jgi:hypothetical protein
MDAGQCPKSVRKCPWSAKVVKSRVHANNMGDVGVNGEKREVSEKCPGVSEKIYAAIAPAVHSRGLVRCDCTCGALARREG